MQAKKQEHDKSKRPDTRKHQQRDMEYGNSLDHSLFRPNGLQHDRHDLVGAIGKRKRGSRGCCRILHVVVQCTFVYQQSRRRGYHLSISWRSPRIRQSGSHALVNYRFILRLFHIHRGSCPSGIISSGRKYFLARGQLHAIDHPGIILHVQQQHVQRAVQRARQ